jgi:hypothetical protein
MADNQQYVQTPIGTTGWTSINRPDEKSNKYEIKLAFDAKTAAPLKKQIEEFVEENYPPKDRKGLKLPFKEEDGLVVFAFKSQYAPKVADAKGNLIPSTQVPMVRSGSKARVKASLATFKAPIGTGVTMRLSAVQIVELAAGGGDGGFDAVDGGFTYDNNKSASSTDWSDDEAEALDI